LKGRNLPSEGKKGKKRRKKMGPPLAKKELQAHYL